MSEVRQPLRATKVAAPSFELLDSSGQLIVLPKPCVMGVINMSPNSFFQPFMDVNTAIDAVAAQVAAGAAIIDIGGEATNPKVDIAADKPGEQQELERVLPLIQSIKQRFKVLVSVDTSCAAVMHAAVSAGADFINDQRALAEPEALTTAVASQVPVCLMHFFSPPRKPASSEPAEMLAQIKQALLDRVQHCLAAGIDQRRIVLDPGFGQGNYSKNCFENYYLLAHLAEFIDMGFPLLVGWSRKSMIGDVLDGAPVSKRLYGSIAAATIAAMQGAAIIRTHDVAETVDAIKVATAALMH